MPKTKMTCPSILRSVVNSSQVEYLILMAGLLASRSDEAELLPPRCGSGSLDLPTLSVFPLEECVRFLVVGEAHPLGIPLQFSLGEIFP